MDFYTKLPTWTLNTEKVEAFKARLYPGASRPPWCGSVEFLFVAAMIGAAVGAWIYGGDLLATTRASRVRWRCWPSSACSLWPCDRPAV